MTRTRWRTTFDLAILAAFATLGVVGSVAKERFTASLPRPGVGIMFGLDGKPLADNHLSWLKGTLPLALRSTRDLTPFLAATSVGLAIATRPRRWRRWRRGRGAVGVAVAAVLAAGWLAIFVAQVSLARPGSPYAWSIFWYAWDGIAWKVCRAVVAAWFLMAILGRWRAGRGWRERLARAVGWAWVAEAAFLAISPAFGP